MVLAMATLLRQGKDGVQLESSLSCSHLVAYLVVRNASSNTVATLVSSHCATADATRTLLLKYTLASLLIAEWSEDDDDDDDDVLLASIVALAPLFG